MDHISHVFRAIWINKVFEIWKSIEQIPPFTSGQVQHMFIILHFGVQFCDLAWSGESRYIAFCNIFSITQRFALENFCFVVTILSFRNMYYQESRPPRFNFNNTVQHKKNSKTKRVDFGKFGVAKHEYEINFFLSRQVFSAFCIFIWKHKL